MTSLSELLQQIAKDYPQEMTARQMFNFSTLRQEAVLQPKYLYRGERSSNWPTSNSTFSRTLKDHQWFSEINGLITGIHPTLGIEYSNSQYSLYSFLTESLVHTPEVLDNNQDASIQQIIVGILQHYGFDTSFIDVTSSIDIAASFAATGNTGDIGKIMIIETQNIEDKYFDLTRSPGNRPKMQHAFALWGTPQLDLKGEEFAKLYNPEWFDFTLTESDKILHRPEILSIAGDDLALVFFEWYETHVEGNLDISSETKSYFTYKIDTLKEYL
jgi:hypothetical protein